MARQLALECHKLLVVRVIQLGQLAHVIAIVQHMRIVGRTAGLIIFVAFALVLVALFVLFATLVEQWWVRIVQDLLGVRSDLLQNVEELFSATICYFV